MKMTKKETEKKEVINTKESMHDNIQFNKDIDAILNNPNCNVFDIKPMDTSKKD